MLTARQKQVRDFVTKIIKKKGAGHSKYYKALLINYPNEEDIRLFRRARTLGLFLPRTRIGGLIEIHGDGGRDQNWTEGCVALTNSDMDDLFARVDVGTPVTIVGNASEVDRMAGGRVSRDTFYAAPRSVSVVRAN
jgi:hypothetical protein